MTWKERLENMIELTLADGWQLCQERALECRRAPFLFYRRSEPGGAWGAFRWAEERPTYADGSGRPYELVTGERPPNNNRSALAGWLRVHANRLPIIGADD